MTRPTAATRLFQLLLSCYPADFQSRFAPEMTATFDGDLERARRAGTARLARLMLRTIAQMTVLGLIERLRGVPRPSLAEIDRLRQDCRFGFRQLIRRPRPSMIAILVLAVGFAASAVAFSVLRGTVLRGLPFEQADQLVHFERQDGDRNLPVTPHDYAEWRAQQSVFEDLAAYVEALAIIGGDALETGRYEGVFIEPSAFALLRARAAHGRTFGPGDVAAGAAPVILLSDRLWRNRFAADPAVVGQEVLVNGTPTRVVGVMPPGFGFPISEAFWIPLRIDLSLVSRGGGRLDVFGRLNSGRTFDEAREEFAVISARLQTAFAENENIEADLKTFAAEYIGAEFAGRVRSMVIGAILVLLIATINVGNLLLARQMARRGDLAVRTALGATRGRLLSLCLGEAFAVAVVGAGLGLALSAIGVWWLRGAWNDISVFQLPHGPAALFWWDIRLDTGVLLFVALSLTVATALAGAVPALWFSRRQDGGQLRMSGRGIASVGRLAQGLVVVQLALMTCLIVPVVLTMSSAQSLQDVTEQFSRSDVITARVSLPENPVAFAQLLDRALGEDPRLADASVATALPFHPARATTFTTARAPDVEDPPRVRMATVAPGYFRLFDVEASAGRLFDANDVNGSDLVVLVNESLAARDFPGVEPLGQRIRLGDEASPWRTVVGVVPDLWMDGERNRDREGVYVPLRQTSLTADSTWRSGRWGSLLVLARATRDVRDVEIALREASRSLDPGAAVFAVSSMESAVGARAARFRVFGAIYVVLGLAALALAMGGIYGVNAFVVALRTPEIGVRMALGATRTGVLGSILRRALAPVVVGLMAGLVSAYWLATALTQVLFQVDPTQPGAFLMAAVIVVVTGLAAAVGPARRASRIDPVKALNA